MKKEEKKKITIEKKIEELSKFFLENYGDEIKNILGTTEKSNNFSLHIFVYKKNDILNIFVHGRKYITLDSMKDIKLNRVQSDNYEYTSGIDIELGNVCIWDNCDIDADREYLSNYLDDRDEIENKLKEDAYSFFKNNYDFEERIKNSIKYQLSEKEIDTLYNNLIKS